MSIKGMTAIWEHSEQEGSALLLLLALADFANDEGVCWPAVGTLAKKIRLQERQTQYLLEKLIKQGALERLDMGGGKGKASTYRVHWPAPIENQTVQSGAQRVQSSTANGAIASAPESSVEPSLSQSSEEAAVAAKREFLKTTGIGNPALDDFSNNPELKLADLQAHFEYGQSRGDSPGLIIYRIRSGDVVPRRRFKEGEFADFWDS